MSGLIVSKEASFSAKLSAFSYQEKAFEAIKDLEYAAVFHEQGLGKSKIAIDLCLHWLKSDMVDSIIVVVKKSLVENWRQEFSTHSHVHPSVLGQDRTSNFYAFNSPSRIYICHYEVFRSEESRLSLFLKTRRVGVILDESQKIKNPDSRLSQVFALLSPLFTRRVIMTGTPVANRPYDIWSQVNFLDQGRSLGDNFQQFKTDMDFTREQRDNTESQSLFSRKMAAVFEKISSFCVRETKAGADIQLPNKNILTEHAIWETIQWEMYEQIRNEFRLSVVKNGLPQEDLSEGILKRLLRLVQVASNPQIIDSSYLSIPGKIETLRGLIEEVVHGEENAIVWSSFTYNVDYLHTLFREFGTVKVHGKMNISERNRSIERFKNNEGTKLLFATPGAAKEGLTLTNANHVIFYDRSFALDDYLQAQDRIHRISQTRTCYVHNIVMPDSVDEWIDVLLKEKALAAQLTQGDIDLKEFESRMSFSMFEILSNILGVNEEDFE